MQQEERDGQCTWKSTKLKFDARRDKLPHFMIECAAVGSRRKEWNGKNIFGYEKERNIKYGGGHYASDCGDGIGGDASGEWHPFDERKEELTVLIGRSL